MLSSDELRRYSRHLLIPEFGNEGQERLKAARVLVIGCGGLGSPILLYLAAAGVGTLGIIDGDRVDESNLQRQILYGTDSIGKAKVEETANRLRTLNPFCTIEPYFELLTAQNALAILAQYDLVVDGSDNFPTRYLVNDACVLLNKPLVYGAIYRFEGQVAVFNYQNSPHYRDLFPTPPSPELAPNCAEAGVLGVLPGIIGSIQANEAIKLLAGIGEPLIGKLFVMDALTLTTRIIKIPRLPERPVIAQLIDYDEFCGVKATEPETEITVRQLAEMIEGNVDFQLIDVRETHEYTLDNLGGELMPLSRLVEFVDKISRTKPVIIHCQSGMRSQKAIKQLRAGHGFTNLKNLTGGMAAVRKMH
ncbi:molybdopterin-synthase adenylyltransferase MoeB [Runella slithyformis]|uniref:Molybdopterin-synthase adenylyltransferase n=1 Tax=Runella slithyformis (strain ATCC 29530 / DSM 19594 / LMG 11500 / NCIMB 11436 / LSU 4) TaxID=761193 RepID=A0A7U4E5U6_RUNSL|nr:molybdopterin-synthase adenylyltransferase MoeB [Runella slithyformis]AEI48941.1 UBA/THIF-type NAD/FAD binding protein [Runella slithyformis DSM 19594]